MNRSITKLVRAMLMSVLVFTTLISIAGRGRATDLQPGALHAWAGGLLLVITGVHTALNRKWIGAMFAKPAGSLNRRLRWLRRVNLALVVLWVTNAATSIVMLFHQNSGIPHHLTHLHHLSGEVFIFAIGLHMLLHWKWLMGTVGRLSQSKNRASSQTAERSTQ